MMLPKVLRLKDSKTPKKLKKQRKKKNRMLMISSISSQETLMRETTTRLRKRLKHRSPLLLKLRPKSRLNLMQALKRQRKPKLPQSQLNPPRLKLALLLQPLPLLQVNLMAPKQAQLKLAKPKSEFKI